MKRWTAEDRCKDCGLHRDDHTRVEMRGMGGTPYTEWHCPDPTLPRDPWEEEWHEPDDGGRVASLFDPYD